MDHDLAQVLIAALGFLGALVASVFGCIKYWIISQRKNNREKADRAMQLAEAVNATVIKLNPIVQKHTEIISKFEDTAQKIFESEKQISAGAAAVDLSSKAMKVLYAQATSEIRNSSAYLSNVVKEVEGLKTEILQLASGNIFVRNKK